ncbi:MAG: hypothetical protein HY329_13555 [Chloroflexi bacterium]|nr:hypothetical protein [Chloroflexota bacterium]
MFAAKHEDLAEHATGELVREYKRYTLEAGKAEGEYVILDRLTGTAFAIDQREAYELTRIFMDIAEAGYLVAARDLKTLQRESDAR